VLILYLFPERQVKKENRGKMALMIRVLLYTPGIQPPYKTYIHDESRQLPTDSSVRSS